MQIFVTSRQGIQQITKAFTKENRPETMAIISITDPGSKPANITRSPGFSGIIRLRFDDVEHDEFWHGQFLNAMRPWQAKEIVDLLMKLKIKSIFFLYTVKPALVAVLEYRRLSVVSNLVMILNTLDLENIHLT